MKRCSDTYCKDKVCYIELRKRIRGFSNGTLIFGLLSARSTFKMGRLRRRVVVAVSIVLVCESNHQENRTSITNVTTLYKNAQVNVLECSNHVTQM